MVRMNPKIALGIEILAQNWRNFPWTCPHFFYFILYRTNRGTITLLSIQLRWCQTSEKVHNQLIKARTFLHYSLSNIHPEILSLTKNLSRSQLSQNYESSVKIEDETPILIDSGMSNSLRSDNLSVATNEVSSLNCSKSITETEKISEQKCLFFIFS